MSTSCILDKARKWGVVLILIVSTVFFTALSGFGQDQNQIVFVEGTVDATEYEVFFAQHLSQDLVGKGATVWSITDVSSLGQSDQWKFVSLVGLEKGEEAYWTVDDNAMWLGNAIFRIEDGMPADAAVHGTEKYAELLDQISVSELSQKAKESLSMSEIRSAGVQSIEGVLPWAPGTEMLVGPAGLHSGGFRSLAYAFDFNTRLNVDKNQAPNMVHAASAGAITWVCRGPYGDETIQIDNMFVYAHLQANSNLVVGRYFNTGDSIAPIRGGTFGNDRDPCGQTDQDNLTYHLHFAFPSNTAITLDDWTIDTSIGGLKKVIGSETRTVTRLQYIRSGQGVECPLSLASNPSVAFFKSKYCLGETEQFNFSSPTNHYLGNLNNAAESFYLRPGSGASVTFYANGLFSSPAACTTSSIGNLKSYYYPGTQMEIGDSITSFSIDLNGNCNVSAPVREIICGYGGIGQLESDCADEDPSNPQNDRIAPSVTNFFARLFGNQVASANVSEVTGSGTATIVADGVVDEGGSGVQRVDFSAKFNGSWHGIGSVYSAPYEYTWDMCAVGVPDGDVEFGIEVVDYAGNRYIWSDYHPNPHITKSFNCNPNQGGSSGAVKLHSDTYYTGSVLWSQGTGFTNEPNDEGNSLSMPDGWSAKVWSDDNRGGSVKCFSKSIHNLQDYGWQNRIQSMEVFSSNVCGDAQTGGTVNLCGTAGCWTFGPGYYQLDAWNLDNTFEFIDVVPAGMSVLLIRNDEGKGTVECYNSPRNPLPSNGSADLFRQVTDLYVSSSRDCPVDEHRLVILYDGRNLDGWSWSAGAGPQKLNMRELGPAQYYDNTLESINIPDGRSVILYDDENQQGTRSDCLTGRHNELISRDNRVSSLEIFDNTSCKPSAPFSFTGSPLSDVVNFLWWDHRYKSDTQYKVYRWNGSDFTFIGKTAKGDATYTDNDVVCSADYYYKVSAVGTGGESAQAGWIKVSTMSCSLPSKPGLLQDYIDNGRLVQEGDIITFEWSPSNFAYDYQAGLYQGGFALESGKTTAQSWTVRDLPPNLYSFGVSAFNRVGQSTVNGYLLEVQAAKADLIEVQPIGCEAAGLYWRNNSQYTGEFIIHRGNQEVGTVQFVNGQQYYSFTDESAAESQSYTYSIETMPADEPNSSLSNEVTVQIPACEVSTAPSAPTLNVPSNNQQFNEGDEVYFSWDGTAEYFVWHLKKDGVLNQTYIQYETYLSNSVLTAGNYTWYVEAFNGELSAKSEERSFVVKRQGGTVQQQIFLPFVAR